MADDRGWGQTGYYGHPADRGGDGRRVAGFEGSLYEGGLRVPAVVEWPAEIPESRMTEHPGATIGILPTVAALAGPLEAALLQPQDVAGLSPVLAGDDGPREKSIGFRRTGRAALIDNNL